MSAEARQQPAGFPGQDRTPLDAAAAAAAAESDRMDRALSKLSGEPAASTAAEPSADAPSAESPADAPAPGAEGAPSEPGSTEPPPSKEDPPNEPPPAAAKPAEPSELAAALDRIGTMEQQLRERDAAQVEREAALAAREEKIAKFEKFAQAAERENFLDAVESLGWNVDSVTKAIVEGRGVRGPQDETRELVGSVESKLRQELEQLKSLFTQRQVEEDRALVAREVATEERAPLLAAFGEKGVEAVIAQLTASAKDGERVTREKAISAIDQVEAELRDSFLKVALSNEGVRKKYADLLGIRDQASPVNPGRPLSSRDASQVARRAESEVLTDEQRLERALRHLE